MSDKNTAQDKPKLLDKNAKIGLMLTVAIIVMIGIWVLIELSVNPY